MCYALTSLPCLLTLSPCLRVVFVGVTQPHSLSSRLSLLVDHEHLKVKQVALYEPDDSSLLYNAMLVPPHAGRKDGTRLLSYSTQSSGSEEVDSRVAVNTGDEEWVYVPLNEEDIPIVSQQEGTSDKGRGENVAGR